MSNVSVPNYPGSIKIDEIIHYNGIDEQDITNLVMHVDINSDINITSSFSNFAIIDYDNWLEKRQFGPGDVLKFVTTQNFESYERRYVVKSVNSIKNLENGKSYVLRCISKLEYDSIHLRISRSYSGSSSDIAKQIFQEVTTESFYLWENSTQPITFIAPSWSPMKCINWLAKRGSNVGSTHKMYFFQDSSQFYNFTSIPKLREIYAKNPIKYRYFPNTSSDKGVPSTGKILTSIKEISFFNAFDIYKEMQTGNIKNTFIDLDINTKSISMTSNSYWDTYSKLALNPKEVWKSVELGPSNIVVRNSMSNVNVYPPYTLGSTNSDFDLSRAQQIEILVVGNPNVDVGHIVDIEIPDMSPAAKGELDPLWSGLYYVVSKRDSIDTTGHGMALRLVKDSFVESRA